MYLPIECGLNHTKPSMFYGEYHYIDRNNMIEYDKMAMGISAGIGN
jgi:hypothetical protein